ncbi:MAG TPA: PilZ domain-containing protein [Nitrospira sp.]
MSGAPRRSRTLVRIPVEFQGISDDAAIKGKGHTLDLNINGCRIESHTPVPRGSYVRLRLAIPKAPQPIVIGMARVRWVQSGAFGVEFIQRSAADVPYISQLTAENAESKERVADVLQSKIRKAPCTVLIVEDDPDVLHLCARTLEEIGCKVLKASGSSEALQACSTYLAPIHLLLIDLILRPPVFQLQSGKEQYPRVHGRELIDHILRIRKKCHVVFMSGHDDSALRALGIEVGGSLCLQKPFSREDLLMAIEQALAAAPLVSESTPNPKPARKAGNAR